MFANHEKVLDIGPSTSLTLNLLPGNSSIPYKQTQSSFIVGNANTEAHDADLSITYYLFTLPVVYAAALRDLQKETPLRRHNQYVKPNRP